MKKQKFIVVQDEATANKLISGGFQVVTCVNGTYTFVNQTPKRFKFDGIDLKKLAYTNILTI